MTQTRQQIAVEVSKVINAPVERVFKAWTDPDKLSMWLRGGPAMDTRAEQDVRVDGQYRIENTKGCEGKPTVISGTYKEILPNEKLVFSWNNNSEEFPANDTLVTVTFVSKGKSTEVTIKHTNFVAQPTAERHNAGWLACLENLAGLVSMDYKINIDSDISASEALSRIGAISDWWTKGFTGRAQQLGDTFTVRFGETFVDFKVTEFIPETKVVWLVVNSHMHRIENKTEWTGTSVVWEALQVAGKTRIAMTHVGLVPEAECYTICEAGWNFCAGESLRKLLTENIGMPDAVRLKS